MIWHWPQYVMCAIYVIGMIANIALAGKPHSSPTHDNGLSGVLIICAFVWILHMGGFW